ncbi:MAG TPA: ABC transporter permease [Actinomycetota bacterium]|nr:ABC transporter permease [Actinomycetota bacterium]
MAESTTSAAGHGPRGSAHLSLAARRRIRGVTGLLLGAGGFLALWAVLSRFVFGEFILPPPIEIGREMWAIVESGAFATNFWATIERLLYGFGLALAIGFPVGYLMGTSRWWRAFFHDMVMVAGSIPGITYAVLALVLFGISILGPVVSVALVSMPYIAINVAEGLDSVDRKLVTMSDAFGRQRSAVVRHVLIPTIAPFAFAGVRLSFALAWKVEQLTEVFGSSSGIGFQIRREFEDFSIPGTLAWVFLFILFMLLVERFILVRLERYLFRWRIEDQA